MTSGGTPAAESLPANERSTVAVFATTPGEAVLRRARALAEHLAVPLVDVPDPAYDILLAVRPDRLELCFPKRGGPGPVYVDFVGGALGYSRRINRFGLLFQAVGMRQNAPLIFDATAGLGQDAFLLAYNGCVVQAVERSPILAALLQDGLDRAAAVPALRDALGDRLSLTCADARDVLRDMPGDHAPDVVYLDPMFPPKKKSALVKKEMRILRQLVGDDEDATELYAVAMRVARKRVVVKRMRHAPTLIPNPTVTYAGKTTRYDVYVQGVAAAEPDPHRLG